MTLREMASESGWSISRLSTRARELGLQPRAARLSPEEAQDFVVMYQQGASIQSIARRSNRYVGTVRTALVRNGIRIRTPEESTRKWPIDHRAFADPMTPEAWYWLGLLATDGCVMGSQLQLNLKASSIAVLERFREFLGCPEKPIGAGGAGGARGLRVYSHLLVKDLARHGVIPRKTESLQVSDAAARQPAFWLGALDGDGSAGFYQGRPVIQYVGTHAFMGQCADFVSEVLGRRPSVHRWSRACRILWGFSVSGDSARQVARSLLLSHSPSMEAKRVQLDRISEYESFRTRARLMKRARSCEYCGVSIDRPPSQMQSRHLFCSQAHWKLWLRKRKVAGRSKP